MLHYDAPLSKGADNVRSVGSVNANATTPLRGWVNYCMFGLAGIPGTEATVVWLISSVAALGTSSAQTVRPSNDVSGFPAASAASRDTYTVDPSFGNTHYRKVMNMRTSWEWYAPPGGELVWPATASNGFILNYSAASTNAAGCTFHIWE